MKSNFAILDVTTGRNALLKRVEKGEKIEVMIRGTISAVYGGDDGVSREFTVDVSNVSEADRD